MPCFIYLCHDLYIYVNLNTCCITIHLCCTKISIFVVLSSLIYVVSTQIYVASRFVSSSTFSITPYSEKLSSPAVACGPTYPTGSEITRHNNEQWCTNHFSIFSHAITRALWRSHRASACDVELKIMGIILSGDLSQMIFYHYTCLVVVS